MIQTSNQILDAWRDSNIDIKTQKCVNCGAENFCQYQGICIKCVTEYHNLNEAIRLKLSGKCSMCGIKSESNTCPKCQRGFC